MNVVAAEAWIRAAVQPTGPLELERARPWATIFRVPTSDGRAWFKACGPVQAFEPGLTAALATRWPDRVARVLAHDPDRAWLLTADAGDPVSEHGNDPAIWLRALPSYAELQRGEVEQVDEHLTRGVPDRRIAVLPAQYEAMLDERLPIESAELEVLRASGTDFATLCDRLGQQHPVASIQHDDLHLRSLFVDHDHLRVLDWGDASVAHPFASLVVTFHWLEKTNGLSPGDPWFEKLRDAYLEPWGSGLADAFELALRVGLVAQAFGWLRHRAAMPEQDRLEFDRLLADLLRRIIARVVQPDV